VTMRPVSLLAALLIIAIAPGVSAAVESTTRSSTVLLLRPSIRVGQSFSWNVRIPEETDPHQSPVYRTDIFTCMVLKGSTDASTVERQVMVILPATQPPRRSSAEATILPVVTDLLPKAPIPIRNGHDFAVDGSPLRRDPTCMFRSKRARSQRPLSVSIPSEGSSACDRG